MMSTKDRKVFVMALVLMALMSIFIPVVSASGSQDWYLCDDLKMDKTAPGSGTFVITKGVYSYLFAGPAQVDLTIGAGTWTLHLDYNAPCAGYISAYVVRPPHGDTAYSHEYPIPSSGDSAITVAMANGVAMDFKPGDPIRLDLWWVPESGDTGLTIYCGSGKSTLSSPEADPGFPVPEMSTLVLFSIGVLALAGYVAYRRRGI